MWTDIHRNVSNFPIATGSFSSSPVLPSIKDRGLFSSNVYLSIAQFNIILLCRPTSSVTYYLQTSHFDKKKSRTSLTWAPYRQLEELLKAATPFQRPCPSRSGFMVFHIEDVADIHTGAGHTPHSNALPAQQNVCSITERFTWNSYKILCRLITTADTNNWFTKTFRYSEQSFTFIADI
jgi:hypothetical protein